MTAQPESPIAAVKQRHRLADVAGRTGLDLPATAGTLTVCCPMPAHGHPDRTPSMRLYLDDDRYYCFGCGSKGDVIQWVQDAEGLDVAGAIAALDERRRIANAWGGQTPTHGHHRAPGPTEGPDPGRTSPATGAGRARRRLGTSHELAAASRRRRLPDPSGHPRERAGGLHRTGRSGPHPRSSRRHGPGPAGRWLRRRRAGRRRDRRPLGRPRHRERLLPPQGPPPHPRPRR